MEGVQGVEQAGALRVVGFGCRCVRCKGRVHVLLGRLVVFALTELRGGDGQRCGGRSRVLQCWVRQGRCAWRCGPAYRCARRPKSLDARVSPRGRRTGAGSPRWAPSPSALRAGGRRASFVPGCLRPGSTPEAPRRWGDARARGSDAYYYYVRAQTTYMFWASIIMRRERAASIVVPRPRARAALSQKKRGPAAEAAASAAHA